MEDGKPKLCRYQTTRHGHNCEREKIINITQLLKKGLAERGLYKHNNMRIKEKHSMVEDGDLEIEGYQ
jgi:hypothetical protein